MSHIRNTERTKNFQNGGYEARWYWRGKWHAKTFHTKRDAKRYLNDIEETLKNPPPPPPVRYPYAGRNRGINRPYLTELQVKSIQLLNQQGVGDRRIAQRMDIERTVVRNVLNGTSYRQWWWGKPRRINTNIGKKRSEETKRKQSEAMKKSWTRRKEEAA